MIGDPFFYKKLPKCTITLEQLLSDEKFFVSVPKDWHVVVADIKESTLAVKNGLHHEVNLAATGSIIAILNEIKRIDKDIRIPYFFGGDGATFLVPDVFHNNALSILENFRHHIKKSMQLTLRVGSMSVKEVYNKKRNIKIAKLDLNNHLSTPIALGTGLKFAEQAIKLSFVDEIENPALRIQIDLDGLECRWQEIPPPNMDEKIVCLLVDCPTDEIQAKVYHSVIKKINELFGKFEEHQPISSHKLKLNLTYHAVKREMYFRFGKFNPYYLIKNWFLTFIGKYYFKYFQEGKDYLDQVSELSYSFMIDGTLNNVISGKQKEINELIYFLDQLEKKGDIIYGIHITHASVLSCYVEDMKSKHIHFVDGTEGGYTTAAKMYKAKMA